MYEASLVMCQASADACIMLKAEYYIPQCSWMYMKLLRVKELNYLYACECLFGCLTEF